MRGSVLQYHLPLGRIGIASGNYTQSRDDKYTSNFAPLRRMAARASESDQSRLGTKPRMLMALQVHRAYIAPRGWIVQVVYELAPVIATIISAHCPGTRAREDFVRACVYADWERGRVHDRGNACRAVAPAGPPGDAPARVPRSCCSCIAASQRAPIAIDRPPSGRVGAMCRQRSAVCAGRVFSQLRERLLRQGAIVVARLPRHLLAEPAGQGELLVLVAQLDLGDHQARVVAGRIRRPPTSGLARGWCDAPSRSPSPAAGP